MGKYNFSAMKFDELERRLAALETANNELRKENAELRQGTNRKCRSRPKLIQEIYNKTKVLDLFGISFIRNTIKRNETVAVHQFLTLYRTVFKYMDPVIYTSPSGTSTISYKPLETLNDEEYRVYVSTIEKIVDIMFEGKQQLEKLKRNTPENVSD